MREMREWWSNVYEDRWVGQPQPTRGCCDLTAMGIIQTPLPGELRALGVVCRILIRLKPEGAPKRYSSEANRRAWEETPEICRSLVAEGMDPTRPWC